MAQGPTAVHEPDMNYITLGGWDVTGDRSRWCQSPLTPPLPTTPIASGPNCSRMQIFSCLVSGLHHRYERRAA
jgi:hypothetical protein